MVLDRHSRGIRPFGELSVTGAPWLNPRMHQARSRASLGRSPVMRSLFGDP